jgi:hypothetical protein
MNDRRDGSEGKNFLSRWSQRKQEARQPERGEPPEAPAPPAEKAAEPEFDLSSLPKLEELTETTDITGFLRNGVPEQLRNAALRKSWALDPAIRNYVNPALDYAYDWNTPGGVPGSSELGAGMDVARLVSQIMGDGDSAVGPETAAADPRNVPADDPAPSSEPTATPEPKPDLPTQTLRLGNETTAPEPPNVEAGAGIAAGQAQDSEHGPSAAPQQVVRRHGSAKPQL